MKRQVLHTALNHRHGRAKEGERVVLYAPTYGARRTLVGAIAIDGRNALTTLEKGLRTETDLDFVQEVLVPMLREGASWSWITGASVFWTEGHAEGVLRLRAQSKSGRWKELERTVLENGTWRPTSRIVREAE